MAPYIILAQSLEKTILGKNEHNINQGSNDDHDETEPRIASRSRIATMSSIKRLAILVALLVVVIMMPQPSVAKL